MAQRQRGGFIILFGTKGVIGNDSSPVVTATCPSCGQNTSLVGKTHRTWFTLFFIPVFPISRADRFSQCSSCGAQFALPISELEQKLVEEDNGRQQRAISLYNSLRASPANSITLNELMLIYASMNEFGQAVSAAQLFPDALNTSEQCMTTLGRVYLAQERHTEAMQWFEAALALNPHHADAHYHKAVAHLTSKPPNPASAVAEARLANNLGHPEAAALLKDAQQAAREVVA